MRSFTALFTIILFAFFVLTGCNKQEEVPTYDPFVPSDDTTDDTEEIPNYTPPVCDSDEVQVYDPNQVITYELDVDEATLEMLDSLGYSWSWGETYDQLATYAESVAIDAPGCDTIVFEQPRVEMGRQMGYQSPYAEGSWIVEYNEIYRDQILGGYDDARYWAPTYDGPVAVMWLYNWSMGYIDHMPHRDMAWMRLRTSWWGGQEAIYNSLEPVKDDFAKRHDMVSLWEGTDVYLHPGAGADCEHGDCEAAGVRAQECFDVLQNLSDSYALLGETGGCYDWDEISAVIAWQDWFAHWDGCGSNNCYQYQRGDASDPGTWQLGLVISGVDLLVNEFWTSPEYTDFGWSGGYLGYACKVDASEGGCRDMYTAYLRELNERALSGQMEADLREVFALRESLGIAREDDEGWLIKAIDWVTARPPYVEMGIEYLENPCGWWSDTGGYIPCDTGSWWDTGWSDTGRRDSGIGDTSR